MKGILIDPFTRTVTEREIGPNNLKDIYDSISAECFSCVELDDRDALYVDDEGLFRENQEYFSIGNYPQPLAGRGLILGTDPEGASVTPKVSIGKVQAAVRWLTPQEVVERYRDAQDRAHAAAKGHDNVFVCMPDVAIDPDTGKARAA